MLFFICLFLVVATIMVVAFCYGPMTAARLGMTMILVVPTWLTQSLGGYTLDLRVVTMLILMVWLVGSGRLIRHLTAIDGLFVALVGISLWSLHLADALSPSLIASLLLGTLLPYAFGRLLIRRPEDLAPLVPYVCVACVSLSFYSVFESLTHINPLNELFNRIGSFSAEEGQRMGLRRAEGMVGHPIFFGMLLAMLFPFSLEAARRAKAGSLASYYLLVPFINVAGVVCTVSRGPLLVVLATLFAALFFWQPKLRIPLALGSLLVVVLTVAAWSSVIGGLEDISGERSEINVEVKDQIYAYTGTRHRELLYLVYADALQSAGWFGHGAWGSELSHLVYLEPELRQLFRSIDNHYIILMLNGGILGLAVFVVAGLMTLIGGARVALQSDSGCGPLVGSIVGANAAVMLLLSAVWMAPGFGFVWLYGMGMISSCVGSQAAMRRRLKAVNRHGRDSVGPSFSGPNSSFGSDASLGLQR